MTTQRCNEFLARYDRIAHEQGNDPYGHGRRFAESILCGITDLDLGGVVPERRVDLDDGHWREIDFAIEEGPHLRLAIEVDGWNKTGVVDDTWTKRDFLDFFRREMQLNMAGWRILRFTNKHVRDEPVQVADTVRRFRLSSSPGF